MKRQRRKRERKKRKIRKKDNHIIGIDSRPHHHHFRKCNQVKRFAFTSSTSPAWSSLSLSLPPSVQLLSRWFIIFLFSFLLHPSSWAILFLHFRFRHLVIPCLLQNLVELISANDLPGSLAKVNRYERICRWYFSQAQQFHVNDTRKKKMREKME